MKTPTSATVLPDDTHCAYPSKTCTNPRAVKQNETLHRLCEFHRRKANLNQLRMQQRRRLQPRQSLNSELASTAAIEEAEHFAEFDGEFGAPLAFQDRDFSPDELKLLQMMLFDSDEFESDFGQDFRRSSPRFSC